jgi:AraC-like DNA-binding protein
MARSWQYYDDLDHVRELIARYDSDHERDILHRGRFRYAIQHVDGTQVQLARIRSWPPQRVRGTPRAFLLHVPEDGRTTYRLRGRVIEASPGRAVLLAPGETFTSWSSGATAFSVRLEEGALRREAAGLAGVDDPERLELETSIPLNAPALHHLVSLISRKAFAMVPGEGGPIRRWEAELTGAVARVWLEMSGEGAGGRRATDERRRVRAVEEWVDAHFTRPITLGELCRVAGLPARSLNRAFLRHRGEPPIRHVVQRRLAEARSRLLERRPGDSVTQVALESGFTHLSRFAGLYRRAYGERPSESLFARPPTGAERPGQKAYPAPK